MNSTKTFLQATEREIIDGLSQTGFQKRKSEEELFSRFAYFIQQAVYKYTLTQEQAFDAYSDSILSAIEIINRGAFEGRSSLKTWLFRIFKNKCVDLVRKSATKKEGIHQTQSIGEMLFQISDTAKSIVQQLIDKTDFEIMKQKLNQLGDGCRQMLLYWAEGISDKQIAIMLEYKTADVVKTSRLRCLDKLKALYKKI